MKNAFVLFTVTKLILWRIIRYIRICLATNKKYRSTCLVAEMFKFYNNLLPTIVAETFRARQNNYNLRHSSFFSIPYVKTVYHGSESLSNLGTTIWNLVPSTLEELRNSNLKTVYVDYVKRIYLMLDSYRFFILFNHFCLT